MHLKVKNDYAVIADDLTGAVDVGGQFHKFGYQVVVFNYFAEAVIRPSPCEVVVKPSRIAVMVESED